MWTMTNWRAPTTSLNWIVRKCFAQSIRALERGVALQQDNLLLVMALGHTYAMSGQKKRALDILLRMRDLKKTRYVPAIYFAVIHGALGDNDHAFACLEKSFQERSDGMTYLKVERLLDPLRTDPRFRNLMRRVGLGRGRGNRHAASQSARQWTI